MSFHDVHLLVRAGGRTYAIPGECVVEVTRHHKAHDVRAIDLSHALGGPPVELGPQTCTVVVRREDSSDVVGLVADEATDVLAFDSDDLVAPPDFGPHITLTWLAALARTGDTFAAVLDVEGVLQCVERNE